MVESKKMRKREHEIKTGENWGEDGRLHSFYPPLSPSAPPPPPPPPPPPYFRAPFTYTSSLLTESLELAKR